MTDDGILTNEGQQKIFQGGKRLWHRIKW